MYKVRWWNLNDENVTRLVEKIKIEGQGLNRGYQIAGEMASYFYKLFNGERFDFSQHTVQLAQEEQPNFRPYRHIINEEVKDSLRKMKVGKAVGPDNILVEI